MEQPRVLDGDDGLGGEVLKQLDLLFGKWLHLLPVNVDGADERIVFEHWHAQGGSCAAERSCMAWEGFGSVVGDVDHLPCSQDAIHQSAWSRMKRPTALLEFSVLRWRADFGRELNFLALYAKKRAELGFADAHCVFQRGPKYRLQFARRRTNDAQDFRRRRLLLQGFPQFVEQPRVLDGNDGLRGEVLDQLDLFVGEGLNLCAVELNDTKQLLLLQHRDAQHRACTSELNNRCLHGIGRIARHLLYVSYLDHLLGFQYAAKPGVSGRLNKWRTPSGFGVFARRTVHGHCAKRIFLPEQERAELCAAEMFGVCQQRFKHGLEITGRA